MIFFTSDSHFGGDDIILREHRPFKNHKRFDRYVVRLWNRQAGKNDIIYHLGDYINYNSQDVNSWAKCLKNIKKIKARVILIIGNNEERIINLFFKNDFEAFRKYCLNLGFEDVKRDDYITTSGLSFYLNHYPRYHKENVINLFGHVHRATGIWKPYGFNVGCDLNYFHLYSFEDIKQLINTKKKWWDNDADVLSY